MSTTIKQADAVELYGTSTDFTNYKNNQPPVSVGTQYIVSDGNGNILDAYIWDGSTWNH